MPGVRARKHRPDPAPASTVSVLLLPPGGGIDRYQDCYFVIHSFAQLMRDTAPDFTPIYARLRGLPALDPSAP